MRRNSLFLLLVVLLTSVWTAHAQEALVAMDLGPASSRVPITESDWQAGVTFDRFFRANGQNIPVTPTSVYVVWDSAALYVRFVCADPEPIYRNGVRLRRTDRVEVGYLAPGAQQQDLWQFDADQRGQALVRHAGRPEQHDVKTEIGAAGWSAEITIPWKEIGGLPSKPFLLQLSRTRRLTGEVLSPSAADFHDGPADTVRAPAATDQFIEVSLGGAKGIKTAGSGLITLPSGTRRWERRALLHHASIQERKQLARLQQELGSQPTTGPNLAERVHLAEIWYDLLDQEGVSFHWDSGVWLLQPGELDPWTARHKFNDALRQGDEQAACQIIDSLLKHFSRLSQAWFADGTPGDVREDAWTPISVIESAAMANDEVVLQARAGQKPFDLFVSFPSTGGVRLHGPSVGHFAPAQLSTIQLTKAANGVHAATNNLTVDVAFGVFWHIDLRVSGNSQPVWALRQGDLSIRQDDSGKIAGVDLRGDLKPADKIVGLGERFDSLDQRGKTLTLWQLDAWDSTTLGGLSNQAYKPVSYWQNTSGYGVFWNTSYEIRADFGNDQENRYRVTANGPTFDLYIWQGEPKELLQRYTALTGRPLLPPAWAFEPWAGGGGERWAEERWESPTQNILNVIDHFRRLDIPHSAIYAEGPASFDPLLHRKLAPMDIHVLTWGRSQPVDWTMDRIKAALPDVSEDKLPLMRLATGKIYLLQPPHVLAPQYPYIDFTAPRSIDLLRAFWKERLDLGVAGTMADFGDLVPRDALFYDGSTGEEMHNWYVRSYNHAVHQVFQERRGDDFILFARGGAPGSQVDAGQMAGDHATDFRGFDESIIGGLSVSTSGFSNWGSDVGGYWGKADEEVYLRWVEFGTFSPLMRFHGTEPREPWYYSEAAVGVYKKLMWVRENIVPYVYGSAQDTHATGVPLMRSMPTVAWDEYMFGDDMLVAPVHSQGEHRTIILPQGHWTDLWTGAPVADGKHECDVPVDDISVFLRAGALVPVELAPNLALGESMSEGKVSALMVTPPDTEPTTHNWKLPAHSEVTQLHLAAEADGFTVTAENWRELQYVLVSGLRTATKSVTVDGQSVPEFDAEQKISLPPGWQMVGSDRLLVRLPVGLKHVIRFSEK